MDKSHGFFVFCYWSGMDWITVACHRPFAVYHNDKSCQQKDHDLQNIASRFWYSFFFLVASHLIQYYVELSLLLLSPLPSSPFDNNSLSQRFFKHHNFHLKITKCQKIINIVCFWRVMKIANKIQCLHHS